MCTHERAILLNVRMNAPRPDRFGGAHEAVGAPQAELCRLRGLERDDGGSDSDSVSGSDSGSGAESPGNVRDRALRPVPQLAFLVRVHVGEWMSGCVLVCGWVDE